MVRQYDLEDAVVYTLFRYRSDGEIREQLRLVAREAVVDPESGEEGEPTYEVNSMDVDEATFEEWLYDRVSSRLADPSDWTEF